LKPLGQVKVRFHGLPRMPTQMQRKPPSVLMVGGLHGRPRADFQS